MITAQNSLPGRREEVKDVDCRFAAIVPESVRMRIFEEAGLRGLSPYKLAGLVLGMWAAAGCPDSISAGTEQPGTADRPAGDSEND